MRAVPLKYRLLPQISNLDQKWFYTYGIFIRVTSVCSSYLFLIKFSGNFITSSSNLFVCYSSFVCKFNITCQSFVTYQFTFGGDTYRLLPANAIINRTRFQMITDIIIKTFPVGYFIIILLLKSNNFYIQGLLWKMR